MVDKSHFAGAWPSRSARVFCGVIMAVVLTAGAASASDPVTGQRLARDLCSGCHLVAEGQRGPVSDGVPAFAALAADPAVDEQRLRGFIVEPHPPMPRVQLTASEVEAIVAYIRSLAPR
jgi:cytochrome c